MVTRYGENQSEEHRERLAFEIATIKEMGFAAYFLIVQDLLTGQKQTISPWARGVDQRRGSIVVCFRNYGRVPVTLRLTV